MNKSSKTDRRQCIISLVFAAIVVVCVCVGVVMNLTTLYDENFDHMGIRTFCMFTVNSNILAGIGMFLTIPYGIDELRKRSYRIPGWLVILLFVLVTSVTITFLVSLFILAPVKGFWLIFSGSRFFLHGVCPILSILAFCFFIKDHELSVQDALLTLIPVFIYASVYFVMVRIIGEEHGGWNDFYGFLTRMPPWVAPVLIMPLTFGVAMLLRFLHNRSCRRFEQKAAQELSELSLETRAEKLIEYMGAESGKANAASDITIPRRFIKRLAGEDCTPEKLAELCMLYLEAFMRSNAGSEVPTEEDSAEFAEALADQPETPPNTDK